MMRILLLFLLLLPFPCFAESTIECHCFQDRSFNSQQPAAADPYLLATAQNSFMALVYGVDKKALVKAKMSGADGSELWIIYEFAELTGRRPEDVARYYHQSGSWYRVVVELKLDPEKLGAATWVALESTAQLERIIADRQLTLKLDASSVSLARGRAAGMNTQELLLSVIIGAEPEALFRSVVAKQRSWGQLLFEIGIVDGHSIGRRLKEHF